MKAALYCYPQENENTEKDPADLLYSLEIGRTTDDDICLEVRANVLVI